MYIEEKGVKKMRGNKPIIESDRIVIEDKVTKIKLIEITDKTGDSIKNTIVRLVDAEYKGMKGETE